MKPFIGIVMAVLLAGCSHLDLNRSESMDTCAWRLARDITAGLEESHMGLNILVSTPVDAVTFAPSNFGLAFQELLIGALAEQKASVVDVQLRKEPYITCEDGLVSLSRDASRLNPEFRADVIVVSTYVTNKDEIVITSRAVEFTTNEIITSATTKLTRTENIEGLLRNRDRFKLFDK